MKLFTLQKQIDYGFSNLLPNQYNNILALNNSSLKLGSISPYHIDIALDHKYIDEDKKEFDIGTAYHSLIFEPEKFEDIYYPFNRECMPYPDKDLRNAENKAYKMKVYNEAAKMGKEILDMQDYDLFQKMRDGLFVNKDIQELIQLSGMMEHTMIWRHTLFDINCKGRIDKYVPEHFIIDLKTIKDIKDWEYQYHKYQYGIQCGFYTEGYEMLTGKEITFIFIVQEKKFPYYAKAFRIKPERLKKAREEYYKYIQNYIDYKNGIQDLNGIENF